jgi:hypothetical protein
VHEAALFQLRESRGLWQLQVGLDPSRCSLDGGWPSHAMLDRLHAADLPHHLGSSKQGGRRQALGLTLDSLTKDPDPSGI